MHVPLLKFSLKNRQSEIPSHSSPPAHAATGPTPTFTASERNQKKPDAKPDCRGWIAGFHDLDGGHVIVFGRATTFIILTLIAMHMT